VENYNVRFLGKLVMNIWDCGGKEDLMEKYFDRKRENILRNVEVII
jgi:Ras-related GTP-binding protein A/B